MELGSKSSRGKAWLRLAAPTLFFIGFLGQGLNLQAQSAERAFAPEAVLNQYCVRCHNPTDKVGDIVLEGMNPNDPLKNHELWEKVMRKLSHRQMPPAGNRRPDESTYQAMVAYLESSIDRAVSANPNPGRTETLRRLTRTEYQNAIRDLLALEIDATGLLPNDEASHGFDNVTVGDLSPTHLERYISAAQKISRLTVGGSQASPQIDVIRIKPDLTQEEHMEGLPPGTRGGALTAYNFVQNGEYEISVRLTRDRNEHVEGLSEPHELEILLDGARVAQFTVKPPTDREDHSMVDVNLHSRVSVTAGPHQLGVTFIKDSSSLLETERQPFQAHFNFHRHPRITPAVFQFSITGPYSPQGSSDTPSRRRIFISRPTKPDEEEACAKTILTALVRRAYRRPTTDADLEVPMRFYREGRQEGNFDAGIERALSAVLVSPEFLIRVTPDPDDIPAGTIYHVSDVELASRLSFFLWSSIPDDELLNAATRGELSRPEGLEKQVKRMLADSRSDSLVTNFCDQWLHLRNLESWTPDLRLFPDFDDNLRQSFRQETEMFVESILREDRNVLDLIKADYTFLNERLAKHYGVPRIYGSRFRRISLDGNSHRGGLLRQGSILTVTSYATRTSPVIRGKWVLENILGAPPPSPPPNVPALEDNTVSASLPMRERLSKHRANPACASCHSSIDPVGFALENFDSVGRWRSFQEGAAIDASGGLPDGRAFTGVSGLEDALLARPDLFVGTLTEKLLTFALGRGIEYYDGPAVRKIVRESKAQDYRFSSLVLGIVNSAPFQMRRSP